MVKRKSLEVISEPNKKPKDPSIADEAWRKMRDAIETAFLLKCPGDFFTFYEFCCKISPDEPLKALREELDIELVGPFELLSRDWIPDASENFSCCYRYFHDPPEFVTVFASPSGFYHVGYFRDDANELPSFMASSDSSVDGRFEILGCDIFSVVAKLLNRRKGAKRALKRDTVCPTLNSVGLRINLHNGIGYRPVPLSNSELVNLLQKIVQSTDAKTKLPHQAKLDELVTLVQFANDEGDFGEGLELGLDLLAFHPKGENLQSASCFNNTISLLLSTGYQLAGRPQFAEVINQHMKNRCIQPTSLKTNS
nr:unnamed protein product [Spirometra erinaceieuropaei]